MNAVQIDFFADEEQIEAGCFGICDNLDDSVKTPAYVDLDSNNESLWVAKVLNQTGESVGFTAVDNKIEIRRDNGDMENRCDAMLHQSDRYIVFVELKDQEKGWIRHAVEDQLATTIRIFQQCHDMTIFRHKLAYACNRRHPRFASSHKEYMQRFKSTYGVRLVIGQEIVLK